MIETVVLVPETDNNSEVFPVSQWDELESKFFAGFGGWTRQPNVSGVWSDNGQPVRDTSRQYVVSLASWRDMPKWLEVADWILQAFRQDALYVKVAGIPEIL